jgi:acyl-CoA thioester hydrolase
MKSESESSPAVEPCWRFVYQDRVQFAETDMAGIVHFSNFYRFMERVEHAFFRSRGLSIWEGSAVEGGAETDEESRVAWPRVHCSCDFFVPLTFQEEFEMELLVEAVRPKSLRYLVRFWKAGRVLAAVGRMAVACVRKDAQSGGMRAVEIPGRIRRHFCAAPREVLDEVPSQS